MAWIENVVGRQGAGRGTGQWSPLGNGAVGSGRAPCPGISVAMAKMPSVFDPGGNGVGGHDAQLRVLIVDDHGVLRAGTRQVLEAAGDILVVGEAEDSSLALGIVDELHPDVVLIDVRLQDGSGIDLARKLRADYPGVQAVILTAYDDDQFIMDAFDAGVTGYLLKTMNPGDLVNAIRAASQGTTVVDPVLARRISTLRNAASRPRLTERERDIVDLVTQGLSNKAIAARLGVSTRTVEGHLNHVFTKLGVESRTALARFALASGLSQLAPPGH